MSLLGGVVRRFKPGRTREGGERYRQGLRVAPEEKKAGGGDSARKTLGEHYQLEFVTSWDVS